MNNITTFPALVISAILCLAFSEILSTAFVINGEFVYTCGFVIVLYAIWFEISKPSNSISSQFGYGDLASFWLKYKQLERSILLLNNLQVNLIKTILIIFSFTGVVLKVLNLIRTNLFAYKTSIQTLNKVKLKIKALPLQ